MKRFPILFLLLALVACSTIDCPVQNTVATRYALMKADGSQDTLFDTLTVVTHTRHGDSVLLNRAVNVREFALPISLQAAEDTLVFLVADTLGGLTADTVRVAKTNTPHFESVDCAASFFHTITAVTHTRWRIDSLTILNPNVTYDVLTPHFNLRFKDRH